MTWNWQQPDWPRFTWHKTRLAEAEQQFLIGAGTLVGTMKHLVGEERDQITIEAISAEAVTTSEIEGEILDRASVQSSIRRQFGLATDKRRVGPAEQGIAEMMVDVYSSFAAPLSGEMLFAWHRRLVRGRRDLKDVGRYRTSAEPMQVVSGAGNLPKVHFEAPPSAQVESEMERFIAWFNRSGPGHAESLPALTRAGTAHLYFECVHPFEDGNGRIGRVLAEKSLAQSLGQPTLIALAATIMARRKGYYQTLEAANKQNEITAWLAWFAGVAIEAQRRTAALVEFVLDQTKLLDRLRGQINERQEKALLRMLREGPEGFAGGFTASKYTTTTGASAATATRDLVDLVEKEALIRTGELKHTRYQLAIPLRRVASVAINERGDVIESPQ
jgi:Fic family protein